MLGLINKLKEDKTIDHVLFDENGGWSLIPSDKHTFKVSRADVLAKEPEALAAAAEEDDDLSKDEEIENLLSENKLLKEQVELLESQSALFEEQAATLSQLAGDHDVLQAKYDQVLKELDELKVKTKENATA